MTKAYKLGLRRKLLNSVVRALAKMGKGPASELGVTGRSSARRRHVMVSPIVVDDATYIVAPYGEVSWVRNVQANPHVSLSKGRAITRYSAVQVHSEEAGRVLVAYYVKNKKHVAHFVDVPGEKTLMDFAAAADRFPVFRLEHI
ncbi:MAG: nitroreductase/quinone reductase family protein [Actinomycetia bacterium]|nr:nitroreductase/quinone reductase family protein [Actinomycetes bacterium]